MNRVRVCVVKIGGSLLDANDLPKRLRNWLATERAACPDTHFVLIVGGGKLVEAIRERDAVSPLGDEVAHWACIELLDATAGIVRTMLPELAIVSDFAALERRLNSPGATLLWPQQFVREIEPARGGTRLAANWSVTSDSIAARLAIVLAAVELVLLKSAPPPTPRHADDWLRQLSAAGYVDAFLPALEAELAVLRIHELP